MSWGDGSRALVDRFAAARALWPNESRGRTYQGLSKALHRHGLNLGRRVAASMRQQMLDHAGEACRRFGFFPVAADGSRFQLARTDELARVFGVAGKGEGGPQLWTTVLWQMGVGLPWDWRVGRANASERDHLRQMVDDTPADTLLVMDAGFTGYELLATIVASGRDFLVRVGRGVTLLTKLGHAEWIDEQTVDLWPAKAQRDRQAPLTLRLIELPPSAGRPHPIYLLTSVREPTRLSDEQASVLYRMRWGVELCYRSLKQTLAKRKLRSHAPTQTLFEIHGLLLGLMLLGLISVWSIVQAGGDPLRWSVASALRTVRQGLRQPQRVLAWFDRLSKATKDPYVRRGKTKRHWPRKKHADPPPGPPRQREASAHEIALARQLKIK